METEIYHDAMARATVIMGRAAMDELRAAEKREVIIEFVDRGELRMTSGKISSVADFKFVRIFERKGKGFGPVLHTYPFIADFGDFAIRAITDESGRELYDNRRVIQEDFRGYLTQEEVRELRIRSFGRKNITNLGPTGVFIFEGLERR